MKNIKAGWWELIFYTDYIGCEIYICIYIVTYPQMLVFIIAKYIVMQKKKNKNIGQKYNTIEKILGTGLEPYTLYYIL